MKSPRHSKPVTDAPDRTTSSLHKHEGGTVQEKNIRGVALSMPSETGEAP